MHRGLGDIPNNYQPGKWHLISTPEKGSVDIVFNASVEEAAAQERIQKGGGGLWGCNPSSPKHLRTYIILLLRLVYSVITVAACSSVE